jgi:hypothetical protein
MKGMARRTIIDGLIGGYLLVALSWHLEALGSFLNSSGEPHHIASAGKTRPIDSRPCWTQWKHIPLSSKSEDSPEVFVATTKVPHDPLSYVIRIPSGSSLAPQSEYYFCSTRSPPVA